MLWDIDLTLIELPGIGGSWYTEALATAAGIDLTEMPKFAGRTELAITSELLTAHGVEPTGALVRHVWRELISASTRSRPTLSEHGRALPGAADALTALAARDGVVQSLVTGNLPEIAEHKLSAFGLHAHLDFEIGGYGSFSAHRPDLVERAVALAEAKHDTRFAPEAVVVVGDTPHDVESALRHGAMAVGVATGWFGGDELRESGAHLVLDDLSDTTAVLSGFLS
ncbi:haloacid dehalogenase-like hydrolase [Prauserella sp. ASG 168]|uniref:Haloacid dehalogenase-like hydrolase n=1 Tax=Prauserella cavernicola TaxID=2800127 RepID=A0A934QU96_9PSEU|nr:haloacid dehalogenase-like hydrolase [Prauserella cavernicola]